MEGLLATLFFAALTIPMYYPISVHPGSMLTDRGDPAVFAWIVSWDIHKFTTGLSGFFNANIFWPHPGGLAYTEHAIGSALLAAPVFLITNNPVLAWNSIVMSSFILSGLGMFLLARRLLQNRAAALIAGIILAYCPWRYDHISHHLLAAQWMPFALLFFHRTLDNPRWRDALLFALFFTIQALCSFYIAVWLSTAVAVVFVSELASRKFQAPAALWIRLAVAGVISLTVIIPTTIPYYRVRNQQGLERKESEALYYSADPLDYLSAPPSNRIYRDTHRIFRSRAPFSEGEKNLFPGILALILALAGFMSLSAALALDDLSRSRPELRLRLKWEHAQWIYLAVAIAAFVLSLGPQFHIFWKLTPIPLPYKLLYRFVPGFQGLRGASRFAYPFMLALAILAAYGVNNIAGRINNSAGRFALYAALAGGIIAEYFSSPVPHQYMPAGEAIPPVYKWLARKPPDTVITELPQYADWSLAPKNQYEPLGFTYPYFTIFHSFQPVTNGQSSFFPPAQGIIWETMMTFPSRPSLNLLRYLGVQYVVLHSDTYFGDEGKLAAQQADALSSDLKPEGSFGSDRLYQVLHPAPAAGRGKLEGLKVTNAYLPRKVMPKSKIDFSFELTDAGEWPAMSFKLTKAEVSISETGPRGPITLQSSDQFHIILLPGQSQWLTLPYAGPEKNGIYHCQIQIKFPEFPHLNQAYSFDFEVGDFPDSKHPGRLQAEFLKVSAASVLCPGQSFIIKARIKNAGDALWRARKGGSITGKVRLAIKDWYTADRKPLFAPPPAERAFLDRAISPGEETEVFLKAHAPETEGRYLIQLDLVDENICWFADQGSAPAWVPVEVKSRENCLQADAPR